MTTTRNIVPRIDGEASLGTSDKHWGAVYANEYHGGGLHEYFAESTGYGIVSGCEPSIKGLTVTVSAGVIHTANGRRIEVPEQSITLDAADAAKPRTDVVYLDKNGTIAKTTGELGTAAVAGSNTYTISTNFVAGDTVTFSGVTFTCTASTQDTTNFALGPDTATSATNLATALNANTTINAIYKASASSSVITITETDSGTGNTPGTLTVTGTGVVTTGTAVKSAAAITSPPTTPTNGVEICTIFVSLQTTELKNSMLMAWRADDNVLFLFPRNVVKTQQGDCEIIVTKNKVMMIDSSYDQDGQFDYLINFLKKYNIKKIDIFLLTHYHADHYGNIPKFLAQTDVDFSNTEWLIPSNVTEQTGKDEVISYLSNTNYRELSKDETLMLAPNVYVDLMCCSTDVQKIGTGENINSIYAMVRHGDVKVLYSGDGHQPEADYVRTTYALTHVDLVKIPHHGTQTPSDSVNSNLFYKQLTPQFVVYNHGYANWVKDDTDARNFRMPTMMEMEYAHAVGAEPIHVAYTDAVFKSDGRSLIKTSKDAYARIPRHNPPTITVYVNSSATEAGDGTKDKPFLTINEAIEQLPINAEKMIVRIQLTGDCTFDSISINNYHGTLVIDTKSYQLNATYIVVENCTHVVFTTYKDIVANKVLVCYYNVFFSSLTINITDISLAGRDSNVNPDMYLDYYGTAYNSPVCVMGSRFSVYIFTCKVDDAFSKTGDESMFYTYDSTLMFRTFESQSYSDFKAVVELVRSMFFSTYVNVKGTFTGTVIKNGHASIIQIFNKSLADTFTGKLVGPNTWWGNQDDYVVTIGASKARPNTHGISVGKQFYDTTLGHMLIWNGSAWLDTITNTTV